LIKRTFGYYQGEEKMKNEKWTAENIPNQKGRVAIVTGSSSGIGFETAVVLPINRRLSSSRFAIWERETRRRKKFSGRTRTLT